MKQIRLTLSSGEYLLVELPEMRIANPISSIYSGLLEPIGQLFGISEPLKSEILEGIRKEGWFTEMPEIKETPEDFKGDWYLGYGGVPQRIVEEIDRCQAVLLDPDKTYCFKLIQ